MFIVMDISDRCTYGVFTNLKEAMEKRDILNSKMRPAYQTFFVYELFDPNFVMEWES